MGKLRFGKGRRRRRSWRPFFTSIMLVAAMLALWWFLKPLVAPGEWIEQDREFGICGKRGRGPSCVNDGDTVTIGYGSDARRIRLTGFDAPEIGGACETERRKAAEAERALREWLNAAPFEWDGGAEPPYDQYGRELRAVRRVHSGGRTELLAETMIEAGLAGGSGWGTFEINWCE